jgi:hypothetical protein
MLNLEPTMPVAPRSATLVRALADLLLEAPVRQTELLNLKEAHDEFEDHV